MAPTRAAVTVVLLAGPVLAGCGKKDFPAGPNESFTVSRATSAPRCRADVRTIPSGQTCRVGGRTITWVRQGLGADVGELRLSVVQAKRDGGDVQLKLRVENLGDDAASRPRIRLLESSAAPQTIDDPFPLDGGETSTYTFSVATGRRDVTLLVGSAPRYAGLRART